MRNHQALDAKTSINLRFQAIRLDLKSYFDLFIEDEKCFLVSSLPLFNSDFETFKHEFKKLLSRVSKVKSKFNDFESMKKEVLRVYDLFKSDVISSNELDFKCNLLNMQSYIEENKTNIFSEGFLFKYLLNNSSLSYLYNSDFEFDVKFGEFNFSVLLNMSINKNIKSKISEIRLMQSNSILSNFSNINFNDSDFNNFLKNLFSKITNELPLINSDLLLKETLYEDFLSKISDVTNKNIFLEFELKDHKSISEDFHSKIKKSILNQIFNLSENRISGFKRSFSRKLIQNVISVDSFKDLFPEARFQNRNLFFFCGETNSGKTYNAFEIACEFESGIYAAPLRLLALEGQAEFEKRGKISSMITGEERDFKPNAKFISSTVEMIDYSKEYDVAIIDEVQMINDKDRGHAWFEAIVGVNAKNVYLVGSEDIDSILNQISLYLNEKIVKRMFERKTKILFERDLYKNEINLHGKLPKNSAVIAFSKSKVLKLKKLFEGKGNTVSVIYGALPPEVRRIETERFSTGKTDVIIATDAIGMGLNLPIEKLFFYECKKFNGKDILNLETSLIKQIAGRAGRYQKFPIGYISAFDNDVFDVVSSAFYKDSYIYKKSLKCSPNYPIIKQIQEITKEKSIFKLLQNYNNSIVFDFDIKNHMNECSYKIAKFIDGEDRKKSLLNLKDKVKLINAPISDERTGDVLRFFYNCIKKLIILLDNKEMHPYDFLKRIIYELPNCSQKEIEMSIKKLEILSWMSFNFKEFNCISKEISNYRNQTNFRLLKFLRE